MKDRTLLSVTQIVDDDTGIYDVGSVDFGVHGELRDFLKSRGEKGKQDVLETLDFLKKEVEREWQEAVAERGKEVVKEIGGRD